MAHGVRPAALQRLPVADQRIGQVGGGNAAAQHVRVEAPFAQDVGRGRTAPAVVADHDVRHRRVERLDLQADEVERHVERRLEVPVLEFARQAHVEPAAALGDDLLALLVVDPLQHRLVEQRVEVVLAEAHQHAVGQHRDGGVALGAGDQRFLAEGLAHAEFGEPDAFAVQRRLAADRAAALDDDVEVVAFVALADHDVAGGVVDALHAHEHGLQVGRRDAVEGPALQQHRHPVVRPIRCRRCSSPTS